MKRKIANRSKLGFVKKFLNHWINCHLHEPTKSTKIHRFKKFVALMKKEGEYLDVEPGYDQCYNFFRDLNPKKWKTEKKKQELRSLQRQLSDLFNKKAEESSKYLLETDISSQFTTRDRRKGAQIQLRKVLFDKKGKFDEAKTDIQIKKELNDIFEDENMIPNLLKTKLKQEMFSKMFGF